MATLPITLEYTIGELKDRAASRRQQTLLKAAPLIQDYYKKLSEKSQRGLEGVDENVRAETLKFYNTVVQDGRFVRLLRTNPKAAADKLNLKLRPDVFGLITQLTGNLGSPVGGDLEAVIAVVVVIAVAVGKPATGLVIEDGRVTLRARL